MIKVAKCIVDKEPCYAEADETGHQELLDYDTTDEFVEYLEMDTFEELLNEVGNYFEKSNSGEVDDYTWISCIDEDYVTGGYTETSLHYHKDNPSRNLKYWKAAIKMAV